MRRKPEILDILKHIHSVAWPYMFGKTADDLQQANAADDEYMISDHDLMVGKFISIPKSYSSFVPGSIVAGMVRGMLDAAGFPARWVSICGCSISTMLGTISDEGRTTSNERQQTAACNALRLQHLVVQTCRFSCSLTRVLRFFCLHPSTSMAEPWHPLELF
eukprot:GHUV01048831.1.p1 GENE.GHUV01048831.1~~GHUV01048831.1.p1  ORF type:complete len:162 (+),score=35.21 GHUV01048831.1:363-848(+)